MTDRPRIGLMRRRLVLEYPQRVSDGAGGHVTTWLALADLWAKIDVRRGDERSQADGRKSSLALDVIVRARPEIVASRRFREGARLYSILAVEPLTDDGAYHLVRCEELNL